MEKEYELTAVLVDNDKTAEAVEEVHQAIIRHGGTIKNELELGPRGLAYIIKKQKTGYYVSFQVAMSTQATAELEADLRRQGNLLRHILVTALKFSERQLASEAQKEQDEAEMSGRGAAKPEEELPPTVATGKPVKTEEPEPVTEEEPVDEGERQKKLDEKLQELLKD